MQQVSEKARPKLNKFEKERLEIILRQMPDNYALQAPVKVMKKAPYIPSGM